jgi:hypothetical protein
MFRSLLYSSTSQTAGVPVVGERAVRDLELDLLASGVPAGRGESRTFLEILTRAPADDESARYRQAVCRDLWEDRELRTSLAGTLGKMRELTSFSRSAEPAERPLLEAAWRLGELELYVDLVDEMAGMLAGRAPASEGLRALRDELTARGEAPETVALRAELPRLRRGIKLRRSVSIGVNLDDRLRPVAAALLSVNEKPFEEAQFLKGFFGAAGRDPYVTQTPLHHTSPGSLLDQAGNERLPLSPLFQELEVVLRSILRPLAKELRAYVTVNTQIFRSLAGELSFYINGIEFLERIRSAGHSLVFPELISSGMRRSEYAGLYNLYLAAHRVATGETTPIVTSDLCLDDKARLYVLTGPNGGGKTTFTQAVGIASVFAQAGFPVPATRAVVSPVDTVITHFPVEEDYNDDIGRFEDEARRLSELFDSLSERSLVLLNEPLASTGPSEAISVAGDVLAGLRMAGVRGIFTTHFHELAAETERINQAAAGTSRIASLSAGAEVDGDHVVRTYRIGPGPSAGTSYAGDIARRYGIDLATLRRRIER